MVKKREALKKLLPIIGILLFIWILSKLDLGGIAEVAKSIRWHLVVVSFIVAFVGVLFKSYKWKKIIDYSGLRYSITNSFVAWLVGFAVSIITPGRVGDFYRSIYLKTSNKKPLGICFASVFLDRILDIIIMLFFAGLGILYLLLNYDVPKGKELAIAIGVVFALGIVFLFVFRENAVRKVLRPLFYRFVPEKYHKTMRKNYKSFFGLFNQIMGQPSKIVILLAIGIVSWLTAFLHIYVLAIALNLDVTYIFIGAIAPVINMIELIPISFSGIGTRDVAMIFFMSLLAIGKEEAVAFSLAILATIYIIALPGLVYWIRHPSKLPEK